MTEPRVCSRAGCAETARWIVAWRNPRIHAPDRRKHWGACDAHAPVLRDHLAARGFPVEVLPFAADDTDAARTGAVG